MSDFPDAMQIDIIQQSSDSTMSTKINCWENENTKLPM